MAPFWHPAASEAPAILPRRGGAITHAALGAQARAFGDRLGPERGIVAIRCDGHPRQYAAFLGAVAARHPVVLLPADGDPWDTGLSVRHLYAADADALTALPAPGGEAGDAGWPALHPDLALLLSTSGSTGARKWVRLSRANLQSNAAAIAAYLRLGPTDRAPMALPFQYSYGLSVLTSHLVAGGAVVEAEGSAADAGFWSRFADARCTGFAGVPHSFEIMERAGVATAGIASLRYMTQAGGKLAPAAVTRWLDRGAAEGWDFVVMYGQTEAAPRMAWLPPALARETPHAVGVAVPGGRLTVEDEAGGTLAPGAVGEVIYRGPNVMMGYARGDGELAVGQGPDMLRTGDLGRVLPNGALEITGRRSRFVKLFGLRVGLDEVEARLAGRGHAAAAAIRDEALHVLLAGATLDDDGDGGGGWADRAGEADAVARDLGAWLGLPRGAVRVHPVAALPRHANGKVDGPAVAARVAAIVEAEASAAEPDGAGTGAADRVRAAFAAQFGADVDMGRSFRDLGGDSLSYLAMALALEEAFATLPPDWADRPAAALAAAAEAEAPPSGAGAATRRRARLLPLPAHARRGRAAPGGLMRLDTATALRALAMALIVQGHLDGWAYGGGGALFLLMVAGWSFAGFVLPAALQGATTAPAWSLMARVAVPTLLLTALNLLATGWGAWPAFAFVSNWIDPHVPGGVWFVDVYLQTMLLAALALALPPVRRALGTEPFRALLLGALGAVVLMGLSEARWDADALYRRLPHLLGWLFLVGAAAQAARGPLDRLAVGATFAAGLSLYGDGAPPNAFLPLAGAALIAVPALPLPRMLVRAARPVAGASLMIYLTHLPVAGVAAKAVALPLVLEVALCLAVGVVLWRLWTPVDRALMRAMRGRAGGAGRGVPSTIGAADPDRDGGRISPAALTVPAAPRQAG